MFGLIITDVTINMESRTDIKNVAEYPVENATVTGILQSVHTVNTLYVIYRSTLRRFEELFMMHRT